jgi:hypothetical protein
MGVPTSEVDYTSATTRRADHVIHTGNVVALEKKLLPYMFRALLAHLQRQVYNFGSDPSLLR